jgi:hypothetical protein
MVHEVRIQLLNKRGVSKVFIGSIEFNDENDFDNVEIVSVNGNDLDENDSLIVSDYIVDKYWETLVNERIFRFTH